MGKIAFPGAGAEGLELVVTGEFKDDGFVVHVEADFADDVVAGVVVDAEFLVGEMFAVAELESGFRKMVIVLPVDAGEEVEVAVEFKGR